MKSMSKSAIIAYDVCPQKYKITYIDKIRLDPLPSAMIKGTAAHKILENYSAELDVDKLYESPRTEIERAMYNNIHPYQKPYVSGFIEYEISRAAKCIKYGKSIRKYFIPLYTELRLKSKKYNINGIIDRVDRLFSDKIVIFDYKTGLKKEISFWNEIELVMYYLLYKEAYPNETISYTGIIYTENSQSLQKLYLTDAIVKKVLEKINSTRNCIEMELFAPPEKPLFDCPCELMDHCEKFKDCLKLRKART